MSSSSENEFESISDEQIKYVDDITVQDNTKTIINESKLGEYISSLLRSYYPNQKLYANPRLLANKLATFTVLLRPPSQEKNEFPRTIMPVVSIAKKLFLDVKSSENNKYLYEHEKISPEEQEANKLTINNFVKNLDELFKNAESSNLDRSTRLYKLFKPFKDEPSDNYRIQNSIDGYYLWDNQERHEHIRLMGKQQFTLPESTVSTVEYQGDAVNLIGFYNYTSDPHFSMNNCFKLESYLMELTSLKPGDKIEIYPHTAPKLNGKIIENLDNLLEIETKKGTFRVDLKENICMHDAFYYNKKSSLYRFYKARLLVDEIFFELPNAQDHLPLVSLTPHEQIYGLYTLVLDQENASMMRDFDQLKQLVPDLEESTTPCELLNMMFEEAEELMQEGKSTPKKKTTRKRKVPFDAFSSQIPPHPYASVDTPLMRLKSIFDSSYTFLLHNLSYIADQAMPIHAKLEAPKNLKQFEAEQSQPTGKIFTSYQELFQNPPLKKSDTAYIDTGRFYRKLAVAKADDTLLWYGTELIAKEMPVKHALETDYIKFRNAHAKQIFCQTFYAPRELDTSPARTVALLQESVKRYNSIKSELQQIIKVDQELFARANANKKHHDLGRREMVYIEKNAVSIFEGEEDADELYNNDEGYGKQFHAVALPDEDEDADLYNYKDAKESLVKSVCMMLDFRITKQDYEFLQANLAAHFKLEKFKKDNKPYQQRLAQIEGGKRDARALQQAAEKRAVLETKLLRGFYIEQMPWLFALLVIFTQVKMPRRVLHQSHLCSDKISLNGFPMQMEQTLGGITAYFACLAKAVAKAELTIDGLKLPADRIYFTKAQLPSIQSLLQKNIIEILDGNEMLVERLKVANNAVTQLAKQYDKERDTVWSRYNEGPQFKPHTKKINQLAEQTKEVQYITKLVEQVNDAKLLMFDMNQFPYYRNACCRQQVSDNIAMVEPFKGKAKRHPRVEYLSQAKKKQVATESVEQQPLAMIAPIIKKEDRDEEIPITEQLLKAINRSPLVYDKNETIFDEKRGVWFNLTEWVQKRLTQVQEALKQKEVNMPGLTSLFTSILSPNPSLINHDDVTAFLVRFVANDFLGLLSRVGNRYKFDDEMAKRKAGIDKLNYKETLATDTTINILNYLEGCSIDLDQVAKVAKEAGALYSQFPLSHIDNRYKVCLLSAYVMILTIEWLLVVCCTGAFTYNGSSKGALTTIVQRANKPAVIEFTKILSDLLQRFEKKSERTFATYIKVRDEFELAREKKKKAEMAMYESMNQENRKLSQGLAKKGLIKVDEAYAIFNNGEGIETNKDENHDTWSNDDANIIPIVDDSIVDEDFDGDDDE